MALAALAGCAGDPLAVSERLAAEGGATKRIMSGKAFRHVVFSRGLEPGAQALHVYVGGDGRAFLDRHRVARDPTPSRPLGLRLMLADPAPSAYVARPCYHGVPDPQDCHPALWTTERYSPAVVDSVAAVVRRLAAEHPRAGVTLIGYSGGGVIALLAAAQVEAVSEVVTLAAPLDIGAWTGAHGYTPLHGSLDPVRREAWPARLRQRHLHGGRDDNVSPAMISGFRSRLAELGNPAEFRIVEGYDHDCCWVEGWPALLAAGAGR